MQDIHLKRQRPWKEYNLFLDYIFAGPVFSLHKTTEHTTSLVFHTWTAIASGELHGLEHDRLDS